MTKTINGRYRLDERIGSGGMGEVWRGEDLTLHRTVAVKMLHANQRDNAEQAARFEGEARALAQIHHPNVVDVYDFGHDGSNAYLVMEFIPGRSLGAILRDKSTVLGPERTAAIMAQAADALYAVHKLGIIHRDVKPDNLMVKEDGTVVLSDFGIARTDLSTTLTAEGSVIGTAYYMSPEMVAGERPVPASDQYALGIVAFRCLSGELPFDGTEPMEVAVKQMRDPVPDLPPDTPEVLVTAILRALRKKPGDRWPDCAAFAKALAGVIPPGETTASMAVAPKGSAPATKITGRAKTSTFKASARPVNAATPAKAARPVPAAAAPVPPTSGASKRNLRIAGVGVACLAVMVLIVFMMTRGTTDPGEGAGSSPNGNQQGVNLTTDPEDDNEVTPPDNTQEPEHTTDPPTETNHPSTNGSDPNQQPVQVQVPNVVGLDLGAAGQQLNSVGLIMDFGVDDSGDPDACTVVRQDPVGDTTAKKGDHVTVYVHSKCSTNSD